MVNKIASIDTQLLKMIRKIVKEELDNIYNEKEQIKSREIQPQTQVQQQMEREESYPHSYDFTDGPWAIFGTPQLDPKRSLPKQERPRALPGWSEPFRPNFDDFDNPPYLATHHNY